MVTFQDYITPPPPSHHQAQIPFMSAPLHTPPTLFPPSSPHRRTMAPCIRTATPKSPSLAAAAAVHIDDPFYKYLELSCHTFPDLIALSDCSPSPHSADAIWPEMQAEARSDLDEEPFLLKFYTNIILTHASLESSLSSHLAGKLHIPDLVPAVTLRQLFCSVLRDDPAIGRAVRKDLLAARDRDPACSKMVHCFIYYKGFLACQAHRIAHRLWTTGRPAAALLIQSRVSEVFAMDIHPGARIGSGVLFDHATGVVIGETAVVGDNVSILHGVTLGGTGKEAGNRHPKIGDGVLVGAGTQILGNVVVGAGAKVGAGSVVLKPVPPRTTAVGNPARLVGGKENPVMLERMAGLTMDHTSWSDYVI